jgi:hypothetical protein
MPGNNDRSEKWTGGYVRVPFRARREIGSPGVPKAPEDRVLGVEQRRHREALRGPERARALLALTWSH